MHFTGVVGTKAWAGVYVTQVCFYTNVHLCDTLAAGCAHMCGPVIGSHRRRGGSAVESQRVATGLTGDRVESKGASSGRDRKSVV